MDETQALERRIVVWKGPVEVEPIEDEDKVLHAMGEAIELGRAFRIIQGADAAPEIRHELSWGEWLWSWVSSSGATEAKREVADFLISIVKARQDHSIVSNAEDYGLEVAKRFLKDVAQDSDLEEVKQLRQELIAARLGISREIMDANEGFSHFAKESHLYRYLAKFGHRIWIDDESKEVYLRHAGVLTPWSELKDNVRWTDDGRWIGYYAKEGVRHRSIFEWTQLEPIFTENPADWGGRYAFEIIVWTAEPPSLVQAPSRVPDAPPMTNTHTCIRLYTPDPEDNVYSVGLTRPRKLSVSDHFKSPLSLRQGDLMCPDETEFWGGYRTSIRWSFEDEELFLRIKAQIEKDKRDGIPYQLTQHNCNEYALKLAAMAGFHAQAFLPATRIVLPKGFTDMCDRAISALPSTLQGVATGVAALVINSLTLFFGSGRVESSFVQAIGWGMEPIIRAHFPRLSSSSAWWRVDELAKNLFLDVGAIATDLVDHSRTLVSHPWQLGEPIRREVEAWRQDEIRQLRERLELFRYMLQRGDCGLNLAERAYALGCLAEWDDALDWTPHAVPPAYRAITEGEVEMKRPASPVEAGP